MESAIHFFEGSESHEMTKNIFYHQMLLNNEAMGTDILLFQVLRGSRATQTSCIILAIIAAFPYLPKHITPGDHLL